MGWGKEDKGTVLIVPVTTEPECSHSCWGNLSTELLSWPKSKPKQAWLEPKCVLPAMTPPSSQHKHLVTTADTHLKNCSVLWDHFSQHWSKPRAAWQAAGYWEFREWLQWPGGKPKDQEAGQAGISMSDYCTDAQPSGCKSSTSISWSCAAA